MGKVLVKGLLKDFGEILLLPVVFFGLLISYIFLAMHVNLPIYILCVIPLGVMFYLFEHRE